MGDRSKLTDDEMMATYHPTGGGRPGRFDDEFPTWQELLSHVVGNHTGGLVYRGQHDYQWSLVTTLERALRRLNNRPWSVVERGIQQQFIQQAKPLLDRPPADDDELGWLMIMQHYGAPTRLLDWTKSPLAAIFFAYEKPNDEGAPRALWTFDAAQLRLEFTTYPRDPWGLVPEPAWSPNDQNNTDIGFYGPSVNWRFNENRLIGLFRQQATMLRETGPGQPDSGSVPIPILVPEQNPRLAAQQAVFTYDSDLAGGINHYGIASMRRIKLPDEWRPQVLTTLRTMGVTPAALFPGLDGVGRSATLSIDLDLDLEDVART